MATCRPSSWPRTTPSSSGSSRTWSAAAQRGHHILVFTEHDDELEVFQQLVAMRGVDGFILSGSRVDDPRVQFLAKAAIPSAMFGRTAPDLP